MPVDEAARQSTSPAGDIALPPQSPRYTEINNPDGTVKGYFAFWRTDEWIYAGEDATEYVDEKYR